MTKTRSVIRLGLHLEILEDRLCLSGSHEPFGGGDEFDESFGDEEHRDEREGRRDRRGRGGRRESFFEIDVTEPPPQTTTVEQSIANGTTESDVRLPTESQEVFRTTTSVSDVRSVAETFRTSLREWSEDERNEVEIDSTDVSDEATPTAAVAARLLSVPFVDGIWEFRDPMATEEFTFVRSDKSTLPMQIEVSSQTPSAYISTPVGSSQWSEQDGTWSEFLAVAETPTYSQSEEGTATRPTIELMRLLPRDFDVSAKAVQSFMEHAVDVGWESISPQRAAWLYGFASVGFFAMGLSGLYLLMRLETNTDRNPDGIVWSRSEPRPWENE